MSDSARDDSFAQLRSIIVGPERRQLRLIRRHLRDSAAQTREVSRVLPDALQLRARDPQLMRALAPSIEDAVAASVQKNPQALADALFPVIGPAIRKAVAHTVDAMIDSINRSIERSISWQAIEWRWVAWRTGKPYAEVVIANTMEYRVEQVFLIHRESGLLLQHVAVSRHGAADADQVSAMLTAITDFARDSFQVGHSETLDSMRVGELAVAIVQGPHAILAAVVRGSIPPPVRAALEGTLESIHRQFASALQAYAGDASAFEPTRPLLETCLVSQRRGWRARPSYRGWVIAAAVAILALSVWWYFGWREQQRFNAFLDRLSVEPGIVLLASGRQGGGFFVSGLRDPLAADPASFVAAANLEADAVQERWEPYQALHPRFVSARAALLLRPPDGVELRFHEGALTASGSAPQSWIDDARRLAPAIAGVRQFTFEGETVEARLAAVIEGTSVHFAKGDSVIDAAQLSTVQMLGAQFEELDALLASSRRRARVEILGYADSDGPDDLNTQLSQARADRVRSLVAGGSLTSIDLVARGLGRAPLRPGASEAEHQQNRRVSLRVSFIDDARRGKGQQ